MSVSATFNNCFTNALASFNNHVVGGGVITIITNCTHSFTTRTVVKVGIRIVVAGCFVHATFNNCFTHAITSFNNHIVDGVVIFVATLRTQSLSAIPIVNGGSLVVVTGICIRATSARQVITRASSIVAVAS